MSQTEHSPLAKQEAEISAQLIDYQYFWKHEDVNNYLNTLGITIDTPKLLIHGFIENDATSAVLFEGEHRLITGKKSVTAILEDIADSSSGHADEPNDFTIGLVLGLDDGNHLAIRYKSEECALLDGAIEPDDGENIDETDIVREFDVVVCRDYSILLWQHQMVSY